MNSAAKGLLGLTATLIAISCAPLKNGAASSGLSSVTIGDFKPESSMKAWKVGKLQFKKLGADKPAADVDLKPTASGTVSEVVIASGSYAVSLEYYEDDQAKILLYKACPEPSSNINFTFTKEKEAISIDVCDKDGKAIGATADTSNVTVTPTARKSPSGATSGSSAGTTPSPSPSTTPTATTGASQVVSYTISSKAGAASNSVEVSYVITNSSSQDLYCHFRPLILFKDNANNFGTEVAAPVKILKGASYTPTVAESFSGSKVFGDATKTPVVNDLKLYGMCRSTEAEAKSMFLSSCMKESATGCDSFVKK